MSREDLVEFQLLDGYVGSDGGTHRDGLLRPSRAADEVWALKDFRLHVWPERFLEVILPRVVVRLGALERLDSGLIQALSTRDRALLEDLYREVNGYGE